MGKKMESKVLEVDTSAPVRFGLKSKIVGAGFKFYTDFAERIGVDLSRLSRITNGLEYPSKAVQKAICRELNLSLRELKTLL
jgi:transcriptional regulator with XRE-family HTH domain